MKKLLMLMSFVSLSIFAELTVVSVLEVDVSKKMNASAGEEIVELLNAFLSSNDDLRVVERKKIEKLFSEQATSEAGFMDEESRVEVQKLYGVKYFVTGKLFTVGSKMYLTTNVIDVETSEKKTFMMKTTSRSDYSSLAEAAGEKLLVTMLELDANQKPKKNANPAEILRDKYRGQTLPKVAVFIEEQHIAQAIIDPAAQTELMDIMKQAGFEVVEYKSSIKSDLFEEGIKDIIADLEDVDIIILGEAISQFALRRGELVSCKGRLELKALSKKGEKVLAIKSITAAGIDVTEAIAGKESLQNCANKLSVPFVTEMMKTWKQK